MSVTMLTKYLSNYPPVVIPTHSSKISVPVVLSDSKGLCLQSKVSSRVENNILWWSERSRTTQAGGERLKENIPNKLDCLEISIYTYGWGRVILHPNPKEGPYHYTQPTQRNTYLTNTNRS